MYTDVNIGLTKKEMDEMALGVACDRMKESGDRYHLDGEGNTYFYPLSKIPGMSLMDRWTLLANYSKVSYKISLDDMRKLYAPYKYQDLLAIQTLAMADRFYEADQIKQEAIKTLVDFVNRIEPALRKQTLSGNEALLYELASAIVRDVGYRHGNYKADVFDGMELNQLSSMQQFANHHVLDMLRAYVDRVENDMSLRNMNDQDFGHEDHHINLYGSRYYSVMDDDLNEIIDFLKDLKHNVVGYPSKKSVFLPGWKLASDLQYFIYRRLSGGYYSNYLLVNGRHLAKNFEDVYGYKLDTGKLMLMEKHVWPLFRSSTDADDSSSNQSLENPFTTINSDDTDSSSESDALTNLLRSANESMSDSSVSDGTLFGPVDDMNADSSIDESTVDSMDSSLVYGEMAPDDELVSSSAVMSSADNVEPSLSSESSVIDSDSDGHIDTRSMVISGMSSAASAMTLKASKELETSNSLANISSGRSSSYISFSESSDDSADTDADSDDDLSGLMDDSDDDDEGNF